MQNAVICGHGVLKMSEFAIPVPCGTDDATETLCARSVLYGIPPDLEDTMKARESAKATQSFGSIASIFRGPFLEKVAAGKHVRAILELGNHYSDFKPPATDRPLS